jgi:plasmid maintenance system antidote protein VapI
MKTPNAEALLDHLLSHMGPKNDAALAAALEVAPPVISKLRNRRLPLGASMLLRMHDATGLSIASMRMIADIPPFVGRA